MNTIGLRIIKGGLFLVTAGCVLWAATGTPSSFWSGLGERMAMASVSLQRADQVADRLAARLSEPHTSQTSPPLSSTTPLGGAEQQPLTEPTAIQANTDVTPPPEDSTGGKVVEQTVGGGQTVAGLQVKNKSGVSVDLQAALAASLPFDLDFDSDQPQVLIYHTHTTEGYMPYDTGYYNDDAIVRDPTHPQNVVAVGDALEAELTAAGIAVIHDTTIYDYPHYRGAYERSEAMIEEMLRTYPSIKVTLDIHRDGLMVNETDKLKPTATVNGEKAAQMMVVCGVLDTASLPHPHWEQNLAFAAQLQQALVTSYPSLMRPLSLTGARYNQYLTTGSLLIEVGSEGNTLNEATRSAHLLGRTLVALWKE